MRVFPVLIDSRPAYMDGGSVATSLLLSPLGSSNLLGYFQEALDEVSQNPITILTSFEPTPGYEALLRRSSDRIENVMPASAFRSQLSSFEPSDWLLLADSRKVPAKGLDFGSMLRGLDQDARRVRHQVALENAVGGTKECIQPGPEGRVMRLQRYYESVTWPFTEGVPCSFVPVASMAVARDLPFASLDKLRAALSVLGVPSRDLTITGGAFDLFDARALLALNERFVMEFGGYRDPADGPIRPVLGQRCQIAPSARLIGPIVVHDDVTVGEGVTIVGPTLLGAGCRVEAGATLAHSLVFPGAVVAADASVRQQVVIVSSEGLESPQRASSRDPEEGFQPFVGPPGGFYDAMADVSQKPPADVYPQLKLAVEFLVASSALVILSPLLLLLAILVKLDSRGPVFYGDPREGRKGRPFRCWKFRTMRPDAAALQRRLLAENQVDGPQFKMKNDPRVTRMGRILRPTNLDELPQLWNILRGQMSFVGPRPSPFRENQMCIPWRNARLSVRPGITGLWQVCRHERGGGDFHQWIYYDLLYVRHLSPFVDLKILLATIFTLGGQTRVSLSSILGPRHVRDDGRTRGEGSLLGRSSLVS